MAEAKTKPTKASVAAFIASLDDETRRKDAKTLDKMFREITGAKPTMWGPAIVGYGTYRYKYESGREGEWMRTGFSPRKANLVVYIMPGFDRQKPLLRKLGKHKTGKSCLYINRLSDIDLGALRELIAWSWDEMGKKYP